RRSSDLDRHAEEGAEYARIGDGERRSLDLLRLELAVAGACGEVVDALRDAKEVQLVRLVHHRNDESRVEVHGDADVDVPAVDDVVAGDGGVDPRELLEHPGDGDGHEGGVADLHALLFPALLVLAPDAV